MKWSDRKMNKKILDMIKEIKHFINKTFGKMIGNDIISISFKYL